MSYLEKKYHNRIIRVEDAVKVLSFVIGGLGFLSVAGKIGLPYSFGFLALFLAGLLFEFRRSYPLPRWLLNTASVVLISATFTRMSLEDFVTPAVEALLLLLAIKYLEEKSSGTTCRSTPWRSFCSRVLPFYHSISSSWYISLP